MFADNSALRGFNTLSAAAAALLRARAAAPMHRPDALLRPDDPSRPEEAAIIAAMQRRSLSESAARVRKQVWPPGTR